jgi:hypothetical protein
MEGRHAARGAQGRAKSRLKGVRAIYLLQSGFDLFQENCSDPFLNWL